MNTTSAIGTRLFVAIASVACTLFAAGAGAKSHEVTVAIHVSTQGVDLSQAADAHTFYARLQNAAWEACTRANRVDLQPVDDVRGCYESALSAAIRSVKAPTLTQVYLENHTMQEAARQGITLRAQLAAK
jgi:UrcA family protein